VVAEQRGGQQVEVVVLRPAPDRREHLVRVGRGEHEDDVAGGLLERLEERVRRRRRQHVDLVDDVHLRAPARAERRPLDQVPDRLDAVVRCGIELGDAIEVPASTARHGSHTPHGSPSWRSSQFRAFARIRAVEVLPVPRGPLNR
jgi:hypothetical protein